MFKRKREQKSQSADIVKLITYPRMLILKALVDSEDIGGIEYSDLLGFMKYHMPGFNDGKLMHQLRTLENQQLVKVGKEEFRNDVRTVVSVTEKGKAMFMEILKLLEGNVFSVRSYGEGNGKSL